MLKKILFFFVIFFMGSFIFSFEECTTAIVGSKVTPDGSILLWKNRDTSHLFNKVVFIKDEPYSYYGVVNSGEEAGRYVYGGINIKGFAIINSVAVNLPQKCGEEKDLEGLIMAEALRKCKTVDDFEKFISENLGESLGALSNFGVIDAGGNGAIFEVYNHGYNRLNLKDFKEGYIINTNFSRSGKEYEGAGYVRFLEVKKLFEGRKNFGIEFLLENVVRDIDNFFVPISSNNKWINTVDSINRSSTASCMIFQVFTEKKLRKYSTMWIVLGEPLTSLAVPIFLGSESIPDELFKGKFAPISEISHKIKMVIRPKKGGHLTNYLDYSTYLNSGMKEMFRREEEEILKDTELFLKKRHDKKDMVKFQNRIAKRVYDFLHAFYERIKFKKY